VARQAALPSKDGIKPSTPLRLHVAAALAFPDGSMTASGLRRKTQHRDRGLVSGSSSWQRPPTILVESRRSWQQWREPDRKCQR
jgi:hypothetical protein